MARAHALQVLDGKRPRVRFQRGCPDNPPATPGQQVLDLMREEVMAKHIRREHRRYRLTAQWTLLRGHAAYILDLVCGHRDGLDPVLGQRDEAGQPIDAEEGAHSRV